MRMATPLTRRRPATMAANSPRQRSMPPARLSLCIGMATHGEFDGVWFTIQALRMYHGRGRRGRVVRRHRQRSARRRPPPRCERSATGSRAIATSRSTAAPGTAVRDLVFREADADVVCCVDSHVLLAPGALEALRDWFDAHPDSLDLLQGPLLHDDLDLERAVTHLEPTWGAGMFGQWARDARLDDPGRRAVRDRDAGPRRVRVPAQRLAGAQPAAARVRRRGGLPARDVPPARRPGAVPPAAARGRTGSRDRPGISYPNRWEDRIRNYLVAWGELGWDVAPMEAHFVELLGSQFDVRAVIDAARELVEHPLGAFDAVLCLAGGDCDAHAHPAPLAWRVERVEPDAALEGEQRRLAAWRRALATASARGYRHVLLLDDGVGSRDRCPRRPARSGSARGISACCRRARRGAGAGSFATAGRLAMAGLAVAVHARAFDRILADLGSRRAARAAFLATWPDLDTYLLDGMTAGTFAAIGEPFAEPAVDRPVPAPDLRLAEVAGGLTVELDDVLARAQQHGFDGARAVRRRANRRRDRRRAGRELRARDPAARRGVGVRRRAAPGRASCSREIAAATPALLVFRTMDDPETDLTPRTPTGARSFAAWSPPASPCRP